MVEQWSEKPCVGGSIPPLGTKSGSSLVVERLVANEKIAGSTPVSRSNSWNLFSSCTVFAIDRY